MAKQEILKVQFEKATTIVLAKTQTLVAEVTANMFNYTANKTATADYVKRSVMVRRCISGAFPLSAR